MRPTLFALVLLSISSATALADCTNNDFGWCQPNVGGDVGEKWQQTVDEARKVGSQIKPMELIKVAFPAAPIMIEAVSKSGIPYLNSAAQNIAAIGAKLDKETQTAITNALTNPSKAVRDAAHTALKAANDTVDAAQATGRYAERTISGTIENLDDAQARLREGKVVDAVWHLGTDRMRLENDNAAKLMEESEAARQVAEKAVAAYGGPAAAAAFTAWLTYNQSKGDIERALLAGTYAYLVSTGNATAGKMPTATIGDVVKKAATVASVRGLAVGAAGGNQDEIMNAIAQGGGSVIVQSGQAYVTKNFVNPAKAKADAFCMDQVNETCADVMQYVDKTKERIEQYKKIANASPTVVVSVDGQWAISWDKQALVDRTSKAPGVVLTYVGQGSYFRKQMTDFRKKPNPDPKPVVQLDEKQAEKKNEKPPPKYHEVTIASNGLWIDDTMFPMGKSYTNNIEFYIDGTYEGQMYLHEGLDPITIELTEGDHILTYRVSVRSAEGGRIRAQECATKFKVSGVDVFNPRIAFTRVDHLRGRISKCTLKPQLM
ncbi:MULTISPECIES: hypothetical protein [Agrobacterium]|uniref:Uncharacterized protein n=1 Tax=Agrobacterium tumefaciens TaxID=358 RepID=A0AAE6BGJ8_AGRTU|nr:MULTISPECIES: hypothetical protein [Agrobacterium]QCL76689.1 hypothetical protein CFBP5499_25265 [Agrobacterium tumefaciens]QCL82209.1 hypothetical protein CFBP5877_24515 [Agrobacterium tumefaciens]CUX65213.1 exported hypothetical protein [Agrobacterium sp. NCPPB 925]